MPAPTKDSRLDYLDAVRAFALLLGIVFHASLSFLPFFIGWAVMDVSTSPVVATFMVISHSFRMETFFLMAGFLGHLTFHRKGAGAFVLSRVGRIVVPFLVGWFILRPLIVSGWIMGGASMRGDVDIAAGLRGGFASLSTLPAGILTGTHLWFLYYLAVITVLALALRFAIVSIRPWRIRLVAIADAIVARTMGSRFAALRLAIPTISVLWFMQQWSVDTPDQTLRLNCPS